MGRKLRKCLEISFGRQNSNKVTHSRESNDCLSSKRGETSSRVSPPSVTCQMKPFRANLSFEKGLRVTGHSIAIFLINCDVNFVTTLTYQ